MNKETSRTTAAAGKAPETLDWIVLILLGAVWGFSFIMIKKAVQVFNPVQMTSWRMVLAFLVYIPIAITYWSKIDWSKWKYLVCRHCILLLLPAGRVNGYWLQVEKTDFIANSHGPLLMKTGKINSSM